MSKFTRFEEKTFFTMTSWSCESLEIRKRRQAIKHTLDHIESQSVEKINIRQDVRW